MAVWCSRLFPAAAVRPYGGTIDRSRPSGACPSWVAARHSAGPSSGWSIRRDHHLRRPCVTSWAARALRDDPRSRFEMCLGVSGVTTRRDRPRAARCLPPCCRSPNGGRGSPRVPAPRRPTTSLDLEVYGKRLERARDLDFFASSSTATRADPNVHAGRLASHPQRKDYPLGRHPRGVQGRHRPAPDERRKYS